MLEQKLYGVWITDSDGTNGRWMSDSDNGEDVWKGDFDEATYAVDRRAGMYGFLRYEVKEVS